MEQRDGPFVAAAFFCEKVLTENDGTISYIRVIDRVTRPVVTGIPPGVQPPQFRPLTLKLVLVLRSGGAKGSHPLVLVPEAPSGMKLPKLNLTVLFEGDERGPIVQLDVESGALQEDGVYWFDFMLDETRITRVPLRIVNQTMQIQAPASP